MPKTCAMEERMRFVMMVMENAEPFAALCRRFEVSRRIGYKWLERYDAEGVFDRDDEATARRFVDIKAGTGELSWMLDDAAAIAGVAHRIAISPAEAEVALLVRSDCQRRGIGEFLVRALLARAARQRLQTLCAVVQRDNRAILRLAEKIGYTCRAQTSWTLELIFDVAAFSQSNR
ncbi:MAG TPA: GNAT family N-acetyltransferase [Xanthobacteraceae bacterium]|nr:GNAT family N-acetyltransferase [Xanthobacteraceae bacterium]